MPQHSLQRISFIDVAKATCIILMVIGHWAENELIITYIYSFHMPALFIISGYLYRSHSFTKTLLGFFIMFIHYIRKSGVSGFCLFAIRGLPQPWLLTDRVIPTPLVYINARKSVLEDVVSPLHANGTEYTYPQHQPLQCFRQPIRLW